MMTTTGLGLFFVLVALYSVFASRLGRLSITMPIVFVVVGALAGAQALGWVTLPIAAQDVETLTEITLALLLFADASTLDFRQVRADTHLAGRLLLIAMPLIIALGSLVAFGLFPQEGIGFALLLGAILAPTDAALGLPIFNNPRVPVRVRRALNVESGLNDGIATPFVTLFIALAVAEEIHTSGGWLASALTEIGIAVAVGIAVGMLGGRLFAAAVQQRWTSRTTEQIGNLALALGAYFGSAALGGNGFIAAFVGGLMFGYVTRDHLHEATEFTETTGTLLSLFVWSVFGANLVIPLFNAFNPRVLLYGLLSLTLVRLLPVTIALVGTRMRGDTLLMMGWLGPRGLASVVFTLMAYHSFHEAGRPYETLFAMAGWTILLSVVLHGISALPLANWYARRLETASPTAPEMVELPELGTRHRHAVGLLPHSG
ncbi:MAG: sodium:proton antiporter [Anaerolineae bacterium]|jgi:NhaP-type Na+/H+ or K+/H+ antiporter